MRGALRRLLTRALPGDDGLLGAPRLGIVIRQRRGLGLGQTRKLIGQRFGNPLMILPSGTGGQRLISRLLDENVPERVRRGRLAPGSREELCRLEVRDVTAQCLLRQMW